MSVLTSDDLKSDPLSTQDTINFLAEEEDNELSGDDKFRKEKEKEDRVDKEKDTETDEGDEEKKEDEIKLVDDEQGDKDGDDKDEGEEQLAVPVKKSVILAKYPKLFKDFPILEKTYYAHQQFAEIFATPEDAREAQERVSILDKFEKEITEDGNIEGILRATKETSPEAFNKIADNYFEVLGKVDPQVQIHVIGGIAKGLIINMVKTGRAQGEKGEPLIEAANIINQYLFESNEFVPQKKLSNVTPENDETKKLSEERKQFINEKYQDARDKLNSRVGNIIKSTIAANIDPKEGMSPYIKKNAINDALMIVNDSIREDKAFVKHLDKLWENAFKNNFNSMSIEQIERAIKSKARTMLGGAIKKVRTEAIRGLDKSRKEDLDRKGPLTPGRSSSESKNRGNSQDSKSTKGMKTLDALNALMDD